MAKKKIAAEPKKTPAKSKHAFFAFAKESGAKYVDFLFTDPKGKTQHTTYDIREVDEELLNVGLMFDGSSIAGWQGIEKSDMILLPDQNSMFVDPFAARPTIGIFCDILDPDSAEKYGRDPRATAKRAEQYMADSKVGDACYFGPELEFFLFDKVQFSVGMNEASFRFESSEGPYSSGSEFPNQTISGHRPKVKGGYFPVQPIDSLAEIRTDMLEVLESVGVQPVLHHHEVAPGQCELGIKFSTLVDMADKVQKYKYVVHNVAECHGKSATFMPKPVLGDNGSGMHVHQSIWKDGKPLFAGNKYAGLSEMALYYIGGIIKHARAINAFTNPTTNSYKRLVPGFEAPILLAYSARNRSASIRIPYVHSAKAKRIECRFPDPASNPYYAFSAMLMAGLDGIRNKIHPGEASDKDLYHLEAKELKKIPTVSRSLHMSLEALDKDRAFLKAGGVFNDDQIDAYIALKMQEVTDWESSPHPIEFINYYSC